jgi:hypothetical protein
MVARNHPDVAGDVAPAPDERPGSARLRARLCWAGGALLAAAVLMACYLRIAGTVSVTSDGAGNALEAWDMFHHDLLLHGWWVTDVSFYTTELPQYALVEVVAGLRPEVVHICAAMTYTLLVLLAAFVARGRVGGARGAACALIAGGVMLAPEPGGVTGVLFSSPDHVGTAVPVLVLLLLLDWARPRWWLPALAFLLLTAAIVGDPLIEVIGVLPLAALCLARVASAVLRGRGSLRSQWYELSLGCAAIVAVPAAVAANRLIVALGGFSTNAGNWGLVSLATLRSNIPMAARSFLSLFGADVVGARGGLQQAFAVCHLAGAALVVAALALAAGRLLRSLVSPSPSPSPSPSSSRARGAHAAAAAPAAADLVTSLLLLAIVCNLALYVFMYPDRNIYDEHEIGPVLALGAALAGRQLGGPLLALRWRPLRTGLAAALAAGLACYAVMLGYAADRPQQAPANAAVAVWLTEHHLRRGLAEYWEASSVTVDTGGAIVIGSVGPDPGGLAPWHWEMDMRIFDPATRSANFVLSMPGDTVSPARAALAFGRPARVYHFGVYTILVWNKNILRDLGRPIPTT